MSYLRTTTPRNRDNQFIRARPNPADLELTIAGIDGPDRVPCGLGVQRIGIKGMQKKRGLQPRRVWKTHTGRSRITRPDTLTTMEVWMVKSMPGTSDPNVTVTGTERSGPKDDVRRYFGWETSRI